MGKPYTSANYMMSDYFVRTNIIQQIAGLAAKNLLIDTIREMFRGDSFFPYREDVYGYPEVDDHTDVPVDDTTLTKIDITDAFKYEAVFLPTVVVRHTGGSYYPISFNQQGIPGVGGEIQYREEIIQDGYGNVYRTEIPDKYIFAGAWDLTYEVKIYAESTVDREELASIISIGLQHVHRYDLQQAGLLIKRLSFGSESEEDHDNGKYYTQSISVEAFGEWRREIPVGDLLERIVFFADIGRIVDGRVSPSNDLRIYYDLDMEI